MQNNWTNGNGIIGVALLLLAAVASSASGSLQPKPNFVVILADDLGPGDLSCYGSKRIKTPHILETFPE